MSRHLGLLAASLAILTCSGFAQLNRRIWIPTTTAVHEINPDGGIVASYPQACFSAVGPCQFTVARDGLGNVFVGQIAYFAPGVSGSVRAFRSGQGQVALGSGPCVDLVVDASDTLWTLTALYSSSVMSVVGYQLSRMAPGLIGPLGSVTFTGLPRLAAHPVDGIWIASGYGAASALNRVASSMTVGPTLALSQSVGPMAADRQGRLWFVDGQGTLTRVVEGAGGALAIDFATPVGTSESVHVDPCGIVHVHRSAAGLSTVLRFDANGNPLPPVSYPVAFRSAEVASGGGYRFVFTSQQAGINLVTFDGIASVVTFVEPIGLGAAGFRGDLSGMTYCSLRPPTTDSDLDLVTNDEEWRRGSDLLDPASRPPTLSIAAVPNTIPPSIAITYADSDPGHAGLAYQLALSLSAQTGFSVNAGLCPTVPLDPDALFFASLSVPTPVFLNFVGYLDAQGRGSAILAVPPGVSPGVAFFIGGVTWSPVTGVVVATSAALPAVTL